MTSEQLTINYRIADTDAEFSDRIPCTLSSQSIRTIIIDTVWFNGDVTPGTRYEYFVWDGETMIAHSFGVAADINQPTPIKPDERFSAFISTPRTNWKAKGLVLK